MAPGEGLIGSVWQNGEADWVEDMKCTDPRFLRLAPTQGCKLWSGYVFPVTYVASEDGLTHSPGVLEFYSSLSRQPVQLRCCRPPLAP